MPNDVLIIHGWSDTSKSFTALSKFLKQSGFNTVNLWLADYISLDDDVKVEDVSKRMEQVVREKLAANQLKAPFDMIVHSTGGLVARHWIVSYYLDDISQCPAKRLIMLAPANFGSKLATMGQSLLGRVIKGWNNWFHTGKEMLQSLELASPFQWQLAQQDLLVPNGVDDTRSVYGEQGVWPFVITGTHPYPSKLRQIVNEDGADGTIRACAANLNTKGVTVDFSVNESDPLISPWASRAPFTIPLAVLPNRTHASITDPDDQEVKVDNQTQAQLAGLVLQALNCNQFSVYNQIAQTWQQLSEHTAYLMYDDAQRAAMFKGFDKFSEDEKKEQAEYFHQYMQVNVHVVDDHGADVLDYMLEFTGPDFRKNTDSVVYFHRQVLEDVHVNKTNASLRCLYVDRTDLLNNFYTMLGKDVEKVLCMSLSAQPPGDNVTYFSSTKVGAAGQVQVHSLQDSPQGRWLQRNCTHFVRIVIPRCPKSGVFKLS